VAGVDLSRLSVLESAFLRADLAARKSALEKRQVLRDTLQAQVKQRIDAEAEQRAADKAMGRRLADEEVLKRMAEVQTEAEKQRVRVLGRPCLRLVLGATVHPSLHVPSIVRAARAMPAPSPCVCVQRSREELIQSWNKDKERKLLVQRKAALMLQDSQAFRRSYSSGLADAARKTMVAGHSP
jgi:hypothetical protein